MKLLSAHIEDLKTLYITELKKALDLEQKITKSRPDLIEASRDSDLAAALSNHLEETRGHAAKVRGRFELREESDWAPPDNPTFSR